MIVRFFCICIPENQRNSRIVYVIRKIGNCFCCPLILIFVYRFVIDDKYGLKIGRINYEKSYYHGCFILFGFECALC